MKTKIVYALLAVLIAVGIWMYVVTVVNPEWEQTFYNIPVVLENEEILVERGFMLAREEEPKVTLRLSGNRADMIKLNSSNITLKADLSRIYSAGEQSLSYSIMYPGDVPTNAFEIISQTPQQITLTIAEWKSKEVDVQVVFDGTVPEQYIAFKDKATLDYEKITVTGPAAVVDGIAMAKVEVSLTGKTDTISRRYSYTLCDEKGDAVDASQVKTNISQVLYTLKIQQWKDLEVRLDVVDGGGLKREDCTINISVPTIRITGSTQQLAGLQFLVLDQILLSELTEDYAHTYDIVLPEGITNLTEQSAVDVTVDIPELATRQFVVKEIQALYVPVGMKAEIVTKEKTVTVRGQQELLDAMTEKNLKISVNLVDATAGMNQYPAMVEIIGEMADSVGVVGSYDVAVTLSAGNG